MNTLDIYLHHPPPLWKGSSISMKVISCQVQSDAAVMIMPKSRQQRRHSAFSISEGEKKKRKGKNNLLCAFSAILSREGAAVYDLCVTGITSASAGEKNKIWIPNYFNYVTLLCSWRMASLISRAAKEEIKTLPWWHYSAHCQCCVISQIRSDGCVRVCVCSLQDAF